MAYARGYLMSMSSPGRRKPRLLKLRKGRKRKKKAFSFIGEAKKARKTAKPVGEEIRLFKLRYLQKKKKGIYD